MNASERALRKTIKQADELIKSANGAQARKREAEQALQKLEQRKYLDRQYDIGRLIYDLGFDGLDDALIAGIMVRGSEAIEEDSSIAEKLRSKGKRALDEARKKVPLEVLFPDRPDRSTSAKLREAGLKKQSDVKKEGKYWTCYAGEAIKVYLERRLKSTDAIISVMTPQHSNASAQ